MNLKILYNLYFESSYQSTKDRIERGEELRVLKVPEQNEYGDLATFIPARATVDGVNKAIEEGEF